MYKIQKEIHTYNGKIIFRVYKRSIWGWTDEGEEFISFGAAEEYVIKKLDQKHGGIVSIDNNVYTFYPYSLPTP